MYDVTANKGQQIDARAITCDSDEVDSQDEEGLEGLETGILDSMKKDLGFAGVMVASSRFRRKTRIFGEAEGSRYYGVEKYSVRFREAAAAE